MNSSGRTADVDRLTERRFGESSGRAPASRSKKALFSAARVEESLLEMATPSHSTVQTDSTPHTHEHMNRRKFMATLCGLALSAGAAPVLAATSKKSKTATLLGKLK